MTVKELHELLTQLLPNHADNLVVMSKDGEGNSFSPLHEPSHALYVAESSWSGEIYDEDDAEELKELGGGEPALVFWPTN
jgi:hypothetical protein